MQPTDRYLAILGDLVRSRDVSDRAEVQDRLRAALRRMQLELRRDLAAGPEITAGDEIQVLLRLGEDPGATTISGLARLTEDLRPVRVVFGLGFGELATPLGPPVRELDGPCFHHARKALRRAQREGRWAVVANDPEGLDFVANALLRLAGELRSGWTDRQVQVIRALDREPRPLQKDVARELGVSPSVVTEVLQAARYDSILETEQAIANLVNRVSRPDEVWALPSEDEP